MEQGELFPEMPKNFLQAFRMFRAKMEPILLRREKETRERILREKFKTTTVSLNRSSKGAN